MKKLEKPEVQIVEIIAEDIVTDSSCPTYDSTTDVCVPEREIL